MSLLIVVVSIPVLAQDGIVIPPEIGDFLGLGTFAALVAVIPVVVEIFKKLFPKMSSLGTQIFSWGIGLIITVAAWAFNFGFLAGMEWWVMLLYGAGASLSANGVFDTGLITKILGVFNKKG